MSERKEWHAYFLDVADVVSTRSTCPRKHVGCVIVSQDKVLLSAGYNGSVRGEPHCDDAGCDLVESKRDDGTMGQNCVRTVHAEQNAIAQAARNGAKVDGAVAFVNTYPCWPCVKVLVNAGIRRIVYRDEYREDPRVAALRNARKLAIFAEGSRSAREVFHVGADLFGVG